MIPMRFCGLVLALALVAGACSGDDDAALDRARDGRPPSTSSTTTSTTRATTSTTSAAEAVAAGQCPVLPARHRPDPERPRYVVHISADPRSGAADGDLTVRFTPDLPTRELVFRLWPNGPRPAGTGVHLDVGDVTIGGGHVLASSRPDATTLVAQLDDELDPGDTIEVSLPWRLSVPGPVQDRFSHDGDALRIGSFLPLLAWEPGIGWAREPATSGFAEATTFPVADFAVSVSVPEGYSVLATGVPDGKGRWRAPAVRDFAMSAGRFRMATGTANAPDPVAVTVGVHDPLGVAPEPFRDKAVRVLEDYARRYGPYPWPAYTLAITPNLGGGIEFPMHVMQGPNTLSRTTSHEIGHMWFYGLVGNNQGRDPWLDEGLASWAEAQFEGSLSTFRSRTIPAEGQGHAGEPMTYWEPRQSAYYRSVYVQSAVALGALGAPDMVDCALRHYVARSAGTIARPEDLFEAIEVVFPDAAATMAPYGLHP
jgi:hypothetical protein